MAILRGLTVCRVCDGEETEPPCWSCLGDAWRWCNDTEAADFVIALDMDIGTMQVSVVLRRSDDIR
jgi:hypothetical protein